MQPLFWYLISDIWYLIFDIWSFCSASLLHRSSRTSGARRDRLQLNSKPSNFPTPSLPMQGFVDRDTLIWGREMQILACSAPMLRMGYRYLIPTGSLSSEIKISGYWLLVSGPDKTQIYDLLSYRGSTKNYEIKDFWFFGTSGCWFLVAGCWFLAAGFWFLAAGFWLLVSGFWLLVSGIRHPKSNFCILNTEFCILFIIPCSLFLCSKKKAPLFT